jgi:hypothetical protein
VRTKGEEKKRRSGGEIECATVDRGERRRSAMAVSKYILVSLPLQGSSSSAWENLQRGISKIAFDIATYKVTQCQRTPEFLDLGASLASARDRISWLLLVWSLSG